MVETGSKLPSQLSAASETTCLLRCVIIRLFWRRLGNSIAIEKYGFRETKKYLKRLLIDNEENAQKDHLCLTRLDDYIEQSSP